MKKIQQKFLVTQIKRSKQKNENQLIKCIPSEDLFFYLNNFAGQSCNKSKKTSLNIKKNTCFTMKTRPVFIIQYIKTVEIYSPFNTRTYVLHTRSFPLHSVLSPTIHAMRSRHIKTNRSFATTASARRMRGRLAGLAYFDSSLSLNSRNLNNPLNTVFL